MVVFITALLLTTPALAGGPHTWEVRQEVSRDRIEHDLRVLTGHEPVEEGGPTITSRHVVHPDIQLAEQYLVDAFSEQRELEVWLEPVDLATDHPSHNVIAELPGTRYGMPWVVIGAHYDSTASFDPSGYDPAVDPAPGADDDGSGIVALLEAARLLADWHPGFEHPIRFVAFTGEEGGLRGSIEHVANLEARDEGVRVALVLDPVGYNPGDADVLWATHQAFWLDEALEMDAAALEIDSPLEIHLVDEENLGGDAYSDHYPFWLASHPALHVGTFPIAPENHTMSDDIDIVDLDFLTEATALATATAATAAVPNDAWGLRACGCATGRPATAWPLLGLYGLLIAARRRTSA